VESGTAVGRDRIGTSQAIDAAAVGIGRVGSDGFRNRNAARIAERGVKHIAEVNSPTTWPNPERGWVTNRRLPLSSVNDYSRKK
jgi:hypothetical protein